MEVIWISAAFFFGLVLKSINLPPLIGFLIAGFLLNIYGVEGGDVLEIIAHYGVLLLLFTVGLKLRIQTLIRAEVLAGSLLHLSIVTAILFVLLTSLSSSDSQSLLILAVALCFSSTVVAAKVLEQKKELRAFHGRVAIGILIMQDLVAVGLLSVAGDHSPSLWALSILALPLLKPVIHKILDWSGHEELLMLYGMILAVVVGGAGFEALGLSSELGALLLGVIIADHERASEVTRSLWNLKELFLVGFFLQIGMAGLPDMQNLLYALALVLFLPVKVLLYFVVLLLFRLRARSSFLTALSLATYSEFGLIIAAVGVESNWIPVEWLVTIAFAVGFSFIIAAPLNRAAHSIYERYEKQFCRLETSRRHPDDVPINLGTAHVLIVGMGRVGTGAYDFMKQRKQHCVGLDSDPGQVEKHVKAGRRVVYADAEDPGLWHNLQLTHIDTILLAMPDLEANTIAATQLRKRGYGGLIAATSVYPEHVAMITDAGADVAYNYYDEVGVGFAEHVWEKMAVSGD